MDPLAEGFAPRAMSSKHVGGPFERSTGSSRLPLQLPGDIFPVHLLMPISLSLSLSLSSSLEKTFATIARRTHSERDKTSESETKRHETHPSLDKRRHNGPLIIIPGSNHSKLRAGCVCSCLLYWLTVLARKTQIPASCCTEMKGCNHHLLRHRGQSTM